MAEKCPFPVDGVHHYVAVVAKEVRTTDAARTTTEYTQVIFCVHCGAKVQP